MGLIFCMGLNLPAFGKNTFPRTFSLGPRFTRALALASLGLEKMTRGKVFFPLLEN